ncbi:MAG: hypothetical protein JST54_07950 [Deltaproteobacteria bacterium]|nr:hypothetical protein [Deltaproteobacteria bacterium]
MAAYGRQPLVRAWFVVTGILAVVGFAAYLVGGPKGLASIDHLTDKILGALAHVALWLIWLAFFAMAVSLVIVPFQNKGPFWKRGWGRALLGLVIFYFLGVGLFADV